MNDKLEQKYRQLKGAYALFWLLPICIVLISEAGFNPIEGIWCNNVRAAYIAETLVILLTIACVPSALKYFPALIRKWIDSTANTEVALQRYVQLSMLRWGALALPVVSGCLCYYANYNTTGALCACISLVASLFCTPSNSRMRQELHAEDGI